PLAQSDGHDAPRLIDELVPCRTTMVDEIVVGFEDAVGEPVVAHELPDVLDRVELWALRRQQNDGDIGRRVRFNNEWLAAAPAAQLTHGMVSCNVSVNDMADRPPRVLSNGEVIDLGGKRVRYIDTPHVPHGWDAGIMFEETTGTLLCGDLFTRVGNGPALTENDIIEPSITTEDLFHYTSLGPTTGATIRKLADLKPKVLAAMHGASFSGDGAAALRALGDHYDIRLRATSS